MKKQKGNGHNKENAIVIDIDEDSYLEQQKKRNVLEQKLLNIQKQKNDELAKIISDSL